ncbi:MltA domain-containing protein [Rhodobacteraceae bacterium NNCM2]|nr:MltA domain-containing protein [Coraliihabitans acroporae]
MGEIDRRAFLAALACTALAGRGQAVEPRPLGFNDLQNWGDDDHRAALRAWQATCARAGTGHLCNTAMRDPKAFIEAHFTPVQFGNPDDALFTGYYEPVIKASRKRGGKWQYPIYGPPADLARRKPHYSRREIETGALRGRGLEIFWLADPVDRYFLHIQGSGRLVMPDGELVRVGFAGKNGHPYASIGKIFLRRKKTDPATFGASTLKRWLRANPRDGAALMHENASFVFFTERDELSPDQGPVGAMGVPLTPERSIAVDPDTTPLGALVWVETRASIGPINRLMVAQDTGSAIKGHQRGDLFFGTGDRAGKIAGSLKAGGRMISLIPNQQLQLVTR